MKKRVRLDAKDPKESKEGKGGKEGKEGKDPKRDEKVVDNIALEDEAQNDGFGEWLRSSSGVELMRLFVIANSVVVFVTMAWPNMQQAFSSVWKMIDVYFKNRFESYLREEYNKNPHMLADVEAYRAAAGKESPAAPIPEGEGRFNDVLKACSADVCQVSNNEDDSSRSGSIPANKEATFINPSPAVEPETTKATESSKVVDENENAEEDKSPAATSEPLKNDSAKRGNVEKKKPSRLISPSRVKEGKTAKKRLKTITLTEKDFQSTRIKLMPQDFAEFDIDEDGVQGKEDEPDGVLVSDLPFKPKADIGDLRMVSPQEFCPLTLEDEFSCDETKTWP